MDDMNIITPVTFNLQENILVTIFMRLGQSQSHAVNKKLPASWEVWSLEYLNAKRVYYDMQWCSKQGEQMKWSTQNNMFISFIGVGTIVFVSISSHTNRTQTGQPFR